MVEPCFLQKKVKAKIAVYLENKKLYYVGASTLRSWASALMA